MKKLLYICLSLVLLVSFAACNPPAQSGSTAASTGSGASAAAEISAINISFVGSEPELGGSVAVLVTLTPGELNSAYTSDDALQNLEIVIDNPDIGTLSGADVSEAGITYVLADLLGGNASIKVQTKDGTVQSNTLEIHLTFDAQ
ncbi:MAG: hypothetical protein ACK5L3_07250 [Oscillospiraceae bacterium]